MKTQFHARAGDATCFAAMRLDPTVQKMLEGHANFCGVGVAEVISEVLLMQQGQFRSAAQMAARNRDGIARRG